MATQAATGKQRFSLVAVCLLAALGAALPADASRYLLSPLKSDLTPVIHRVDVGSAAPESLSLLTAVDERVLAACSALGQAERQVLLARIMTRDLDGFLTDIVEQGGVSFHADVNDAGRVVYQSLPGGINRTLGWNYDGTLDWVKLADGTLVDHSYDDGGRITRTEVTPPPGSSNGGPGIIERRYDLIDQLTLAWDDVGVELSRTWATTGELLTETVTIDGTHSLEVVAGYDRRHSMTSLEYPDDSLATIGRDSLGRMTFLRVDGEEAWRGDYHGLRLGGGVAGLLELTRRHTAEGLGAVKPA